MRYRSALAVIMASYCVGLGGLAVAQDEIRHDPTFETRTVVRSLDDCIPDAPEPAPPCTYARFRYPIVVRPADEAVERINESVQAHLRADFYDGQVAASLTTLGDALLREYAAFRAEFPDMEGSWALDRSIEIIYSDERILSFRFDEYSYLGGAHPNGARSQWVVDRVSGRTLALTDLLVEGYEAELTRLGEIVFRAGHGLAPDESLEGSFWFEDNRFALNDNWAVVESGLAFRFDAYEVSSYALGPTDFVIARADLTALARPEGPLAGR